MTANPGLTSSCSPNRRRRPRQFPHHRRHDPSLVTASQSATGALQAAQAGNQLLALQSQQLSDVVAVLSAKSRADALEQARTASAEAQGQQNYQTFRTTTGYVPGTVTMFSSH